MARGDLYSEHPEWFRETISKTVVPYERQPQWKSLDARRFVEEGIEGQDMPTGDKAPCPHCEGTGQSDKDGRVARFEKRYPDYRYSKAGTEGQKGWDAPEPSWKDEPDSDYRRHPAGRFVGSTVAGGNPKHWEPRTKGSKDEFHTGHV